MDASLLWSSDDVSLGGAFLPNFSLSLFQGSNLLYLDPHEAQPCAPLPAAAPSYFCSTVRLMPVVAIDPSLAIGFHCRTLGM